MFGNRQILICRGDASAQSLPQAAKLPVQGHRAPGKQSSGLFSVVRTPGKLSCGEFSVRTGRQTPVDGAGRPVVGGFPGKCLHCSGPKGLASRRKDGRGRSHERKRANRRYRRGKRPLPPAPQAPSPEPLPSVAGKAFGSRQPLFLFPVPCSLGRSPRQIRIFPLT